MTAALNKKHQIWNEHKTLRLPALTVRVTQHFMSNEASSKHLKPQLLHTTTTWCCPFDCYSKLWNCLFPQLSCFQWFHCCLKFLSRWCPFSLSLLPCLPRISRVHGSGRDGRIWHPTGIHHSYLQHHLRLHCQFSGTRFVFALLAQPYCHTA